MNTAYEWRGLWERIQRRVIRAADVLSIMALDAVILIFAYIVVRLVGDLAGSGNRFYDAARIVSAAVFLVLYLVWVAVDLWEFLTRR
jgi:hypothetical protein